METSNRLFEIVEDEMIFDSTSSLEIEHSEDTEDGTYPLVVHYVSLVNKIDREGASAWLNWGAKNKLKRDLGYATAIRESKHTNEGKLVFDKPIKVQFGLVSDEPIIREVSEIEGSFTYEYFWTKNGRQSKIVNGFIISFEPTKYLK